MNCPKCGMINNENSKFCIKCGQSLVETLSFDSTQNVQNNNLNNVSGIQGNIPNMESVNTNSFGVQPEISNVEENRISNASMDLNQSVGISNPSMNANPSVGVSNPSMNANPSVEVSNLNMNANPSVGVSNPTINSSNTQSTTAKSVATDKVPFMNYFFIILAFILKPITAFKEEGSKFNQFKNSAILAAIVSIAATILNLLTTMIDAVIVKNIYAKKTEFVWENLKNLKYFELIFKNLLMYIGIIAAIAGVFYIASLIIKKTTNFAKLVGIGALAVSPAVICSLFLSPILSKIYAPIGMAVTIIGLVYTIVIIYEFINQEFMLEGNTKIYFNLICISILAIAAYYLYTNVVISSVANDFNDISNWLGY